MDKMNNQQLNVDDKELNIQRFIRDNEKNGKTFEEIKQILSKVQETDITLSGL